MIETMDSQVVINRLVEWAEMEDRIRAVLLYSSRANPESPVDIFSDFDILLAVTDVRSFHSDDQWLNAFGDVLVVFRNPIELSEGFENFGFITHYENGVKIDYSFFPVDYLKWAAKLPGLPEEFDNGYIILLDKDGLTVNLKKPSYRAYLPVPPTGQEFLATVEEFFNDAIYVAKHLWRDNLMTMKYILEYHVKFTSLRKLLVWHMECENGWQVKPGAYGKGLKKHISSEIWAELEHTYVGAGIEENWEALFDMITLFRKLATDVADRMGFSYPYDMDRKVVAHIEKIRDMTRAAAST